MGLCASDQKPPRSSAVRDTGAAAPKPTRKHVDITRLVLIGPGESGKSTIFKQMKLIEAREMGSGGFSAPERQGYVQVVHDNIVSQMRVLLRVAQESRVELPSDTAKQAAAKVREGLVDGSAPEMGQYCRTLWAEPAIRGVYAQRDLLFNLNDGASYLFDRLDAIYAPGYVPSNEDLLRVRLRTVGSDEATFTHKDFHFQVTDVGGQRSERRKWQELIELCSSMLFCSALTEWDQKLREDPSTVRLRETLALLRDVLDLPSAQAKPLIIMLTKADLLREKLGDQRAQGAFRAFFPEFAGELTADTAIAHIKKVFHKAAGTDRDLYIHSVVAVDTDSVHTVWKDVRASLLRSTMNSIV